MQALPEAVDAIPTSRRKPSLSQYDVPAATSEEESDDDDKGSEPDSSDAERKERADKVRAFDMDATDLNKLNSQLCSKVRQC